MLRFLLARRLPDVRKRGPALCRQRAERLCQKLHFRLQLRFGHAIVARVHFRLGRCVNGLLEQITTTDRSEIAHEVCSVIDKAIHCGYRIYPCNYIAYDKINNTDRFADHYTQADVDSFENYVNAQLDKVELDDVTPDEREYMYSMMLTMYANPLKNQLAAVGC